MQVAACAMECNSKRLHLWYPSRSLWRILTSVSPDCRGYGTSTFLEDNYMVTSNDSGLRIVTKHVLHWLPQQPFLASTFACLLNIVANANYENSTSMPTQISTSKQSSPCCLHRLLLGATTIWFVSIMQCHPFRFLLAVTSAVSQSRLGSRSI